jgi:hypothetical protein
MWYADVQADDWMEAGDFVARHASGRYAIHDVRYLHDVQG